MSDDLQQTDSSPEESAEQESGPAGENDARPAGSILSLRRVFAIVIPVAVVMLAVVLGFGFFDGAKWINDLLRPPLVAGSGQVMFRGVPLAEGELRSRPNAEGLPGAMGFLDEEGRFELQTEIDGVYVDGAFVGEHKVTVTKYGVAFAAGVPPLTPRKYESFETTPLKIVVSQSSEDNSYSITLLEDPDSPSE